MTAIALTIAGSDSSGGAGIQADLKTFSALGVYGCSVLAAVTAQNTRAVTAVESVSPGMIAEQIAAVLDDLAVGAVKIGMLGGPEAICAVASALAGCAAPVVLDPVMVAKSGDVLLPDDALETLRDVLLSRAALITPNLPDGAGPLCTDLLIRDGVPPLVLEAPRVATRNTHGTGCTLSAAIAAGLALGRDLDGAVEAAHRYLQGAIRAAGRLAVGHGNGPVHHFFAQWGPA
ncbi:MAG: bifunctional hydroxymethylpyrimidine kinase/phosphomethylpyrimidine kinase [Alphaproteobacteria bacterium HGW-Alphaproteobacteria-2]|nr:MAG: bifunctional hydroxymethylpyrimidine kinase/phosphomethylpyrimidine kinase [Alphaproteobacteria bacterium HGW-Alphaproteobacteria-2]